MLSGGWRIGRIGGIDIRLDASWGVIAVLITFNFWVSYSDRFRHLGGGAALALAVLTAALFFGSVLGHELAHAGMSKVRGIPVSGITLFLFGGATHAKVEAKGPADEFLVTVVGPATSALLGGAFYLVYEAGRETLSHPIHSMFGYLAFINLMLAGFNLLPGFPLDGGRLLRSGLWRATSSLSRATRMAARVGQGVGLAIVGSGVVIALAAHDVLGLVWPAFIGWFLFRAASATLLDSDRRLMLESTTVRQVMSSPPPVIPAGLRVGEVLDRYLAGHEGEAFPVMEDGQVVGLISAQAARAVPPDREVREAMVESRGVTVAGPEETMDAVTERLSDQHGQTVLVTEAGRLVGVIERGDLARLLARKRGIPPARESPPPASQSFPPRPDEGPPGPR